MTISRYVKASRIVAAALLVPIVVFGCSTSSTGSSGAGSVEALQLTSSTALSGGGALRVVKELPAPQDTQNGSEQPLSPNDLLEINVFQVDNLNRTVQIDAGGQISLPLIGTVKAAGKTVRQLEKEIETAYGAKYLQSPDVTVFCEGFCRPAYYCRWRG